MDRLELRTDRLRLRRWNAHDLEPFAAINADPMVMEFFPATLSRDESDTLVDRIEAHFDEHGFGLWAAELMSSGELVGFVGLWATTFEAHFSPAIEVGWRLARNSWGVGLAPEAARAALADGFDRLGVEEVVSFTAAVNLSSRRVMDKLGMTHDASEDFDHPSLPAGHMLRPHVLYRLPAARFPRA